ncbi:hypothetical protein KRR40_47270 [Niabella defluvii]|nr:hypothetical protein KRR40_47270 [Niabella sp. I65]
MITPASTGIPIAEVIIAIRGPSITLLCTESNKLAIHTGEAHTNTNAVQS